MWIYSIPALTFLLLVWYSIHFSRYVTLWKRMPVPKPGNAAASAVSLVIPFRNEEASLPVLLESLEAQETKPFEILFVDDHSSDSGVMIIRDWAATRPYVKLLTLSEGRSGKKAALEMAVRESLGNYILCSDADTWRGPGWIAAMTEQTTAAGAVFVSGPVNIEAGETAFSRWQSLEFAGLIAIGAAAIAGKKPNMCNGANLLFSKQVYNEVGGYRDNASNASGDDMFLMHKMFQRYPDKVVFCKSQEAIVHTLPKHALKDFIAQRVRWASKAGHFTRTEVTHEMAWIWALCFLIGGQLLLAFFMPVFWLFAAVAVLWKMGVEYLFFRSILPFFGGQALLKHFWISSLAQGVYVFAIGVMAKFVSFEWKGRKYA